MDKQPLPQRRWVWWALIFAAWTVLGLLDVGATYFHWGLVLKKHVPWWQAVGFGFCDWYIWAALTPAVFWLARRFSFRQGRWPLRLLFHLVVSLFFAIVVVGLGGVLGVLLGEVDLMPVPYTFWEFMERVFVTKLNLYVLVYWVLLGANHALVYYHQYHERRLEAARLETRLAEARLQFLKMQLDPHFLFNTLNAISALMHQDVELADRMVARLGDLLRLTLDSAGTPEVPLRQELDFIAPYLEIQKARFGSRLDVCLDIDPETEGARVPNLILQPLVENAIRHGIAPRPEGGRVEVRACRRNGTLRLEVRDDGPGLAEVGGFKEGVGLANTRARLRQLYGPEHRLELCNGSARGLVVTLEVPFRTGAGGGAGEG
jgi:two-component system, LytTR family, sensor kinase